MSQLRVEVAKDSNPKTENPTPPYRGLRQQARTGFPDQVNAAIDPYPGRGGTCALPCIKCRGLPWQTRPGQLAPHLIPSTAPA
jgi:hypothetical protein